MRFLKKTILPLAVVLCMMAACLVAAGCAGVAPEESSGAESAGNTETSGESSVTRGDLSDAGSEESAGAGDESDSPAESGDESKESSAAESKENSKEESKESSKEESKETSKEESKETSKEESKDTSKEESKDTSKEESKDTSKEESGDTSGTESGEEPDPATKAVVGKWKAEIDLESLMKLATQTVSQETSENQQFQQITSIISMLLGNSKELKMTILVTMNKDGTFVSDVDGEALKQSLAKAYEDYYKEKFEAILKLFGKNLDEYLESQNISLDALAEAAIEKMDLSQMHQEGTYRVSENRVYMNDSEEICGVIEVKSDDKILLVGVDGIQDDHGLLEKVLPMTFDRVK